MSEPIPESIPTSHDRKSHRPTKKRALTPTSQQSNQIDALFANPSQPIHLQSNKAARTTLAPPEIVANVQGSSAGAGSGEFHVYKASRRREYERLRLMDEEVEKEERDREWAAKKEGLKKADTEKLSRNQAKRAKAKARKEKAELAKKGTVMEVDEGNGAVKKKLAPVKVVKEISADQDAEVRDVTVEANGNGGKVEDGVVFHDDD